MTQIELNRLLSFQYACNHAFRPARQIVVKSIQKRRANRQQGRQLVQLETVYNHPSWQSWPSRKELK